MASYFVDPLGGADVPGGGAIGAPWKTTQYALNTIVRDAVNGDKINIRNTATDTLAAQLSFVAYGAPTATAPVVFRGYANAENDGGRGTISGGGGGFSIIPVTSFIIFCDMRLTNTGAALVVRANTAGAFINCEVDTNTAGNGIQAGSRSIVDRCYVHGIAGSGIQIGNQSLCTNCYVTGFANFFAGIVLETGTSGHSVTGNIVYITLTSQRGIDGSNISGSLIKGNVIYSSVADTVGGIYITNAASYAHSVYNNIICGFSGVGGVGISDAGLAYAVGYNAFWNNTANENYTLGPSIDLGNDVALGADPFTNAGAGNFMLTAAAQALLRSVGWPSTYLGATSTDTQFTIGAVQYGEGGGGRRPHLQTHGN